MNRLALAVATFVALASSARAFDFPKLGVPDVFGGGKDGAPLPPGATPDCPDIFVDPGTAQTRAPASADAANVRYQLSIGQTARECVIDGDRITIKVGIEGAAMLGPVGQAGAFSGNLRVAVRDRNKDAITSSKNYRVGATVPAGASRAPFSMVADPITLPLVSPKAQNDYEILVGFTGGEEKTEKPASETRKKRR